MEYLLLIYGDETAGASMSPEERDVSVKSWGDYDGWLTEKGWKIAGEALQPTQTATTVREQGGKIITTDGPFAETKEQLGGFYLIRCENLDQALEAASKMPNIGRGSVEVRPIMDFDPEGQASS
jgi:hypothetical protein